MSSLISARQNLDLLEKQYLQWQKDPLSVGETWATFFEGFTLGLEQDAKIAKQTQSGKTPKPEPEDVEFFGKVVGLIYNYRALGHTQAHINPLEEPEHNPRLDPEQFELSVDDMDRVAWNPYFRQGKRMTLREMIGLLEKIYSGNIGFEFKHIHQTEVRHWLRKRIEERAIPAEINPEKLLKSLRWVLEAELFETFIGKRFLGEKRFSNEGGEGVMILLNAILEACPSNKIREIEMGMSHRGRLNVLANFVRKSIATVLHEFTAEYEPDLVAGDGDVKYHLGYESERELPDGKVRISLAANPSHLEAVNAVVEGKARARQRILSESNGGEIDRSRVLPILLHGDAAFAGQGSVAEVLNLSQLPGYRTGGTIHIIINNQIGFTTTPADARSSSYATDVAKMIEAPVLHLNGEEPMELFWAALLALEFRQTFARDIVLDLYCYRRQGHNEADQAAFTQPALTRKIVGRPTFAQILKEQALAVGISSADVESLEKVILEKLEFGYQQMITLKETAGHGAFSGSTGVHQVAYSHDSVKTGISQDILTKIGAALTNSPSDFHIHPTLAKRFIPRRQEALKNGGPFDWAFAEALAFGSLLLEGTPVRLSGQDVGRGTFSQRHIVMHDYETGAKFLPLEHISNDQAKLCVHNSLLSEFAVLGFDYGYSLSYPKMLTLWEAQFGDFANGAQVIIDQFISSSESKWKVSTDLVMLLPHGYEGQGPEHSSARLERYLQLCAEENLIVANLTTPAQYFHILRRQKRREFRKPLILMTPKSLLSRPEATSGEEDFLEGSSFQEILADSEDSNHEVNRIIFCSGKVYYDLAAYRNEHDIKNAAIIRIEQLYPLHAEMIGDILSRYANSTQFVWCQEEPSNMGAWTYMAAQLENILGVRPGYAGREAAASPAVGFKVMHKREQQALLEQAFSI